MRPVVVGRGVALEAIVMEVEEDGDGGGFDRDHELVRGRTRCTLRKQLAGRA